MNAKKRASRRILKSDLARVDAHVIQSSEYEELPELTEEMLSRAKVKKGRASAVAQPEEAYLPASASKRHRTLEGHWAGLADPNG